MCKWPPNKWLRTVKDGVNGRATHIDTEMIPANDYHITQLLWRWRHIEMSGEQTDMRTIAAIMCAELIDQINLLEDYWLVSSYPTLTLLSSSYFSGLKVSRVQVKFNHFCKSVVKFKLKLKAVAPLLEVNWEVHVDQKRELLGLTLDLFGWDTERRHRPGHKIKSIIIITLNLTQQTCSA